MSATLKHIVDINDLSAFKPSNNISYFTLSPFLTQYVHGSLIQYLISGVT